MTKKLNGTRRTGTSEATEVTAAIMLYPTLTDAAVALKITRATLYSKIEKYNLREIIEKKKLEAYDTLLSATNKAAENFVKKIDHSNPQVSMDASREVLDRAGLSKQEKPRTAIAIQGNEMSLNFVSDE